MLILFATNHRQVTACTDIWYLLPCHRPACLTRCHIPSRRKVLLYLMQRRLHLHIPPPVRLHRRQRTQPRPRSQYQPPAAQTLIHRMRPHTRHQPLQIKLDQDLARTLHNDSLRTLQSVLSTSQTNNKGKNDRHPRPQSLPRLRIKLLPYRKLRVSAHSNPSFLPASLSSPPSNHLF